MKWAERKLRACWSSAQENIMALSKLFKINPHYSIGTDTHYNFIYLAEAFVEGPSRHELHKRKISEMKGELEKQHPDESIALIRMLLVDCGDKRSSDLLAEFDTSKETLFAGKNVKDVENRELYNFRRLLLQIVTKLQPSQMDDMVTYLQEEIDDHTSVRGSKLQSLLVLFEKARQQDLINPHTLDKLKQWLEVFERADLIQDVNQFEPRKRFPGAPVLPMQSLSIDSAIGDEDSRERSGSGAPELNSLMSYSPSTELEARLRSGSTEEKGPRERSELVSGNTANAKNNLGTAQ